MTDLDQIKQKIDIVTLIGEYVQLKKTGANFKGLCPFHSEKTPSFIVSPERQIWHCFGGCQDGGDIFKFLMRAENLEFPEALKILAKRAGVTLTSYQPSKATELKERIYAANHLASEFYNYLLTKHPLGKNGLDYVQNRKISPNSINLFKIGYAPNSWDSLMKFLLKKGYSGAEMEAAGLVSKSGIGKYFDRFRGRVMFTLCDHRGNVVGFAGRLLDPEAKEAKYINTAETAAYTKGNVLYGLDITHDEIKKAGFAVVVEGEIDAISSYQAGVRNVVAIKGSALTAGHISLLKRYTENVYLSLDSDFAGDAAAHRGIEMADQAGLNIKVVTFSQAKDPDELVKIDPKLWREAVEKAVPFYDYVIDNAATKYAADSADGGKKILSEVTKFIEPIDNLIVKNHYLKKLARVLGVSQEVVQAQLAKEYKKLTLPHSSSSPNVPSSPSPKSRSELLEEYLLSLLLQSSRPSDYLLLISPRLKPEDFTNQALGKIYQLMVSLVDNPKSDIAMPGKKFDIKDFVNVVPPEALDLVDRLYLQENKIDLTADAATLEEIQRTVWEIKELTLREKLKKAGEAIKKHPDDTVLEETFTETTAVLQQLRQERQLLTKN
ncbi:DNA primase [Patescibacteria group bacterium]|nr:DNA primase [Patescibacteria group bacterium]